MDNGIQWSSNYSYFKGRWIRLKGRSVKYQEYVLCSCEFVSSIPTVILDTLLLVKPIQEARPHRPLVDLALDNVLQPNGGKYVGSYYGPIRPEGELLAKDSLIAI
jgi:hypothetical protein